MAGREWTTFVLWVAVILLDLLQTGLGLSDCQPPCLYIADKSTIMRMPLNSTSGDPISYTGPQVIVSSGGHMRSIDVDPTNNMLYWGDFFYHSLNRSTLNGTSKETILSYAVGYPEGLTIDWSSGVLYWTDSLMKFIEVTNLDGTHRKVLFDLEDDDEPRGITSSPKTGFLFWTDWGRTAKIERSSLSGKARTTLISTGIRWPNDLTYDEIGGRLYWIDASLDRLESCDHDGNNRVLLQQLQYSNRIVHPYSMVYFGEHNVAYFTDWISNSLYSYRNTTSIVYSLHDQAPKSIGQLSIHQQEDSSVAKPCLSSDNHCSHLCLKHTGDTHMCACPTGMSLMDDSKTCGPMDKEYEIFFADSFAVSLFHVVKFVDEPGFTIRQLPIPSNEKLKFPFALDYDQDQDTVYWTDYGNHKLYRMKTDGSDMRAIRTTEGQNASLGIAVSQMSDLIYFFGSDGRTLMVSRKDGSNAKTIVSDGLVSPRDIVLSEEDGYIFVSDPGQSRLYRYDMDGRNMKFYYRLGRRMVGIDIDRIEKRLYWADYEYYSIESVDFDLKNKRVVVQKTIILDGRFYIVENLGSVLRPQGLAILGERMFWTDTQLRAILSASKRDGGKVSYITGGLDHPRDLHVFNDQSTIQYRKKYTFSYSRGKSYVTCYASCPTNVYVPNPPACPAGYRETRMTQACANCTDPVGANTRCFCTDWASCAQRAYGDVLGCLRRRPALLFKVRECVQAVRPGYCLPEASSSDTETCNKMAACTSDGNCGSPDKCCKTGCGMRCMPPIQKSDFPCRKSNGGCSHFCIPTSKGFHCDCPPALHLLADGKTCSDEGVVTPCHNKPCLNNGHCTNTGEETFECRCQSSYVGQVCQIDTTKEQVLATFVPIKYKLGTNDMIKEVLSDVFDHYCDKPHVACSYNDYPVSSSKRSRRDSSSHIIHIADGYFRKRETYIDVLFSVLHPPSGRYPDSIMTRETVIAGLRDMQDLIEDHLGLKLYSVRGEGRTDREGGSSISSGGIAAIVFLVVVVILFAVGLLYYRKRKRQQQKPDNTGTGVQFSFENDLYTDLYPTGEVPPEVNANSGQSFANPAYQQFNAGPLDVDQKGKVPGAVSADTPREEEAGPLPQKQFPVDFSESDEPPPPYTSQAPTPAGSIRMSAIDKEAISAALDASPLSPIPPKESSSPAGSGLSTPSAASPTPAQWETFDEKDADDSQT